MAARAGAKPQLMAYFSHSYRPQDNRANLYFWEMLSGHGLYFAVDPPSDDRRPMAVTYLEWLMEQSACFVAVIPRREDAPSPFCSPHQLFEYRLAVRARKPRLVFLEEDLEPKLLRIAPEEIVRFGRRKRDLEAFRTKDQKRAREFVAQVRRSAAERQRGSGPIGLLTRGDHPAYAEVVRRLEDIIQGGLGRSFELFDPRQFDADYRLLHELDRCEVLVSEIRPAYIPADLYGVIHGLSRPTLRIAHLEPGESRDAASTTMQLSSGPFTSKAATSPAVDPGWPIVLRGYRVDPSMEPVLFWEDPEDLCCRVAAVLHRMVQDEREVLDEDEKARKYFLRLGRLEGKVFISNYNAQNGLATQLANLLRTGEVIRVFHYADRDRDARTPNWKDDVRRQIDQCTQFVALIDEGFNRSPWCQWEMEVAVDLFKQGTLELHTYKIKTDEIPKLLWRIDKHVQEIGDLPDEEKLACIAGKIVESFERGRRVSLESFERSHLLEILTRQREVRTAEGLVRELQAAGLPDAVTERARKVASGVAEAADLGAVIDVLADFPTWIKPWKTPLGTFLAHATRDADPLERGKIWEMIRDRSLMPDVRHWVERSSVSRELGLTLEYDDAQGTVGIFDGIRERKLEGWRKVAAPADGLPLPGLLDLFADQTDWEEWVAKAGRDIAAGRAFAPFHELYRQAVGPGMTGDELLGICVASDASGLRVPIEWATFTGLPQPLALKHPVRRYLLGARSPRRRLRSMLTEDRPVPLRVLIVGAHLGDLPWVDDEIAAVRDIYVGWFEKLGWPLSDLHVIEPGRATAAQLKQAIRHGGYHLLHFAGHGTTKGEEPALIVIDDAAKNRYAALPASMLREWATTSDLRFVYLSSCQGAGEGPDAKKPGIHRFENLAEALVLAGVPEVVSFRWLILDQQSRAFAERFHRAYLEEFDASVAAFHARKDLPTSAQIWAASLVIAQYDSATPRT